MRANEFNRISYTDSIKTKKYFYLIPIVYLCWNCEEGSKKCIKMKIFAIVLIVFISESRFSSETTLEELEEAVFQGTT